MVGFIREPSKKEEESVGKQHKSKNTNCSENFRFDFEGFSSEFGGFSLPSVDSFFEFDSLKDWIEEMQSPDNVEIGSGVDIHIGNDSVDLVGGINGEEKSLSIKGCSVSEECIDSKDGISGDSSLIKSDELKESSEDGSKENAEMCSYQVTEVKSEGLDGDTKPLHGDGNESHLGILGDGKSCKIESLDCSIEEGLEKVKLVGDEGGLVPSDYVMKELVAPAIKEDSGNDSDSNFESETSSASSSTSSSSSESDDDDDDSEEEEESKEVEKLDNCRNVNTESAVVMEEGQIMDSDADNMVSWSEDDDEEEDNSIENSAEFQFDDDVADEDEDTVKGPIKSKNELEVLPPVPPVDVTLQPSHQILPVGMISSVLGAQVIVEGSEKHNPLSEGSILWITESRLPLGIVDEIFGPVKTPYYIVRYNSESEVPSGIQNGTLVGFVAEFVGHVLNDKNLYQKGYDASGENDEEVLDELNFSDDEKEAEYKRMLKMSKRGNTNQGQGPGNMKKKNKNRNKTWTKDQPSMSPSPNGQSSQPGQLQQRVAPCVPRGTEGNWPGQASTSPGVSGGHTVPPLSSGYQLGPSPMGPFFPGGPAATPQQVQQAGLLLNGLIGNLIGLQQQNMGPSSGFQMNNMPLLQQNHPQNFQVPTPGLQQQHISHPQMPLMNPTPFQQPFDLSQLVGASATPFRPASFPGGPPNGPWVGTLGQNYPIQAPPSLGVQGQGSQLPMLPSIVSNSQQGQSFISQPQNGFPGNGEVSSQFNSGSSSGRGGRGQGRKTFHHRGGRFNGGRGRNH